MMLQTRKQVLFFYKPGFVPATESLKSVLRNKTATKEGRCMNTASDILNDKKNHDICCVTPQQTVSEAVKLMAEHRIGAILVKEGENFIGIFSERDFVRNSADEAFHPVKAKVADYMSAPLYWAPHDATLSTLQEMFLGLYIRHLPIQKEGRYIGVVSIGDVIRAELLEKDRQIKDLKRVASWKYYENWGWDRKLK